LHEERLARLPHVVGLGIVPMSETAGALAGGRRAGRRPGCAVAVYVDRKLPEPELAPNARIPATLEVPGRGKTSILVPTQVIEIGEVQIERP